MGGASGKEPQMTQITRRMVLRNSLAVAAAGSLARPFIANAAASTATVWWTQGFVPEEDAAFKKLVSDYQKQSGNTIDFSLIPFAPLNQKTVSALTSGDVPDLIDINTDVLVPQNAWADKMVDVSDVVDTQKDAYHPTVYLATQYYNNVAKKRSIYIVPYKTAVVPFHIWNSLVEKAGFKLSDAPKTWDAFWDFFTPMQAKLRDSGMRNVYALGMQCTTTGPNDGNNLFNHFLIANGGNGIVTKDGKVHLDDPQVKEAAIKAITSITKTYKDGYVPPGALSWNDADDNNAFHSKLFVMDFDGTISTEVAIKDQAERDQVTTMGLPLGNDGKPIPAQLGVAAAVIPKGAKNIDVAKDFMKYVIQPQVTNNYLNEGLGRFLPAVPSLVKSDPFWLGHPQRKAYTTEGLLTETVPNYPVFNPGWAEVNAQQIWGSAEADVIRNGMDPKAATEAAFRKVEAIAAKYPIVQS
jgi:multiple sugar transport system substrate-binding protein